MYLVQIVLEGNFSTVSNYVNNYLCLLLPFVTVGVALVQIMTKIGQFGGILRNTTIRCHLRFLTQWNLIFYSFKPWKLFTVFQEKLPHVGSFTSSCGAHRHPRPCQRDQVKTLVSHTATSCYFSSQIEATFLNKSV